MTATAAADPRTISARLLRGDSPAALVRLLALVAAFWLLDVLTRSAADLDTAERFESVLIGRVVATNTLPVGLLVAGGAALVGGSRGRVLAPWSAMDRGRLLRALSAPMILVAAWYASLYDYNFVLDQWHTTDRLLVVVLAGGALLRPALLVPFVLQVRVVITQFETPFGATASENIHDLPLLALLIVGAMQLVVAVTDDDDTSPMVLLLGAAVASHFFEPGRAKLAIDWISENDLGNFALASYANGWLGGGDGGWARDLASFADTWRLPLLGGTLLLEVGAIVAVTHYRLLRWWLAGWIGLHAAIFAMSGFWLFEWIVVEAALLAVLTRPTARDWLAVNATPARAAIAAMLVLIGGHLFHPPSLAWLDAPVSYAYEIEATGESGASYHVPLDAFTPLQQHLSLGFAQFRSEPQAVGGYGAARSRWVNDQLEAATTFTDVEALERRLDPVSDDTIQRSVDFVAAWIEHVNARGSAPWSAISPPTHYWTSRPDPVFDFDERLAIVEVVMVTSVHDGADQRFSRRTVVTLVVDDAGRAVVSDTAG